MDLKKVEELVQELIEGRITFKRITEEYKIDIRTFRSKTIELRETNPELYEKWVMQYSIKSKEVDNIDFIKVLKYIIKQAPIKGKLIEDLGIGVRTFDRKVQKLIESDAIDEETGLTVKELINLGKRVRENKLLYEDQEVLDQIRPLQLSDCIVTSRVNSKEEELRMIIEKYDELIISGVPRKEAEKIVGIPEKKINLKRRELEVILIEKETVEKIEEDKSKRTENFRKSLKTKIIPSSSSIQNVEEIKNQDIENEITKD